MRILWVSLRIFDDKEETETAVWLKALAVKMVSSPEIILANISCKSGITELTACDYSNIKQWAFPFDKYDKNGCPSEKTKQRFSKVVEIFKPDIIQVWGSENFFKLLPFDNRYPSIKVLTMQGILDSIAPILLSGLSFKEKISTIGLREIISQRSIFNIRKSFEHEGRIENIMIKASDFIITQSDWTDSQIRHINPAAKLYRTHRSLRELFLDCKKWNQFSHDNPILYSAAVGYPLKGLHILIKALAIVKKQYPNVVLRLAGATGRKDFLGDGYLRMILRLIKKNDLETNVTWLGPITATGITENLQQASAFINPSFVESYSLALAEAMSVGTPGVISFAGAMPELADNNKEALFFTPMDYKRCAFLIIKLLSDKELSLEISKNAILRSEERNVKFDILNEQLEIYRDIIRSNDLKNRSAKNSQ
jgi:glycosyltransferase involved in cell wall biosynthesis